MARRAGKSITAPIVMAAVTVPLSIALLVGWTFLIVQNTSLTKEVTANTWLLVLGALAFVVIMLGQILFTIFLAREILEVRRQNSFIDSVTHELKSPLASLKLCLETLARSELTMEQRESLRQIMLDDVERLSAFIDDVLQASRLAHDRIGVNVTEIALAPLVRQCAGRVAARTKVPPEAIVVDVPEDLKIHTDRSSLEIVLKNLIDNAVKYSDPPIRVTVRARSDGGRVLLEVQDAGIGIPPRMLRRVFQRFYRVPEEQVHARRGTGLGLFVVHALVRSLGGRIEALSEGPGRGTTMRVFLPEPQAGSAA